VLQIPLALVNANMSPRSAARWGAPPLREAVKRLLGAFTVVSPQTAVAATRLAALGVSAHQLTPPSNLKYAAAATTAAKRPVVKRTRWWVAGSTHPGEEDAVLHVHELTVRRWHDLVTVVVPRHPERAAQVQALAAARGLACMVVDAADGLIELVAGVGVYVVRSIGQLSALYSQAPVAFVGGSLLPTGRGHNVAEAAMVGCAVLVGRHTGPFAGMVRELRQLNSAAVWEVEDTQTLATALGQLLADATRLDDAQQAARQAVQAAHHGTLERTWTTLDMRVLSKALSVSYSGREPHT
jgi:3-deoxy-D-manno-octulosonic-acid transferase